MIREKLLHVRLRGDREFRWRGGDVSRLEGLTDAVFAFAVTLLVVSLDVPHSFDQLAAVMRGFFAFGLCFALLVYIWYCHYVFFRRFGLEDPVTVALNGLLLFVVLFYIYPLKFLYVFLARNLFGVESAVTTAIEPHQIGPLMIIYGLGFFAIFVCFALLYAHAYRRRDLLRLDPLEVHITRSAIGVHLLQAGIALVSVLMVVIGGAGMSPWAGVLYGAIGPTLATYRVLRDRSAQRLRELPEVKARLESAEAGVGFSLE